MTAAARSGSDVPAIEISALRKNYGRLEAVKGIDLEVRAGEIYGLIGPDGAGKTSTIHILGGVMSETSGVARIFGVPARESRPIVGYLTQAFSLYPDLTVAENLRYIGELRHLTRSQITERGMRYLGLFDMAPFTDRLAGRLSGGMKQKLALACALITEPRVLLLDEPTTGVDPVSRREFWDTLADLSSHGMTMVVATPYLDEAERCSRVSLMYDGRIVESGTPKQLRDGLGLRRLELRSPALGKAEKILERSPAIEDVQRFGDRLDLLVWDAAAGERATREELGRAGIGVDGIRPGPPTLENTFVAVLRDLENKPGAGPFPRSREIRERPPGTIAIGAERVGKAFGDFEAVRAIDLAVGYGEVYGLLGANGAGKTTVIKMLCGLLAPTTGTVELAGERGTARSREVRKRVGYMSQKFSLHNDLTIGENLDFFGGVYGVPCAELEEKKRWVLEFSGLAGRESMITGELPGGWKQRVAFGAAILHEPSVLFLDEPTSGVDPLARREFWKMINELADRGVAILVTTHYLEEAEQCNRLGFMVAGEIVAEGTPTSVKAAQSGHLIEIVTEDPQRASRILKSETDPWRVSLFGDRVHVVVEEGVEEGVECLRARLAAERIEITDAYEQTRSLEDVFIAVVESRREG